MLAGQNAKLCGEIVENVNCAVTLQPDKMVMMTMKDRLMRDGKNTTKNCGRRVPHKFSSTLVDRWTRAMPRRRRNSAGWTIPAVDHDIFKNGAITPNMHDLLARRGLDKDLPQFRAHTQVCATAANKLPPLPWGILIT